VSDILHLKIHQDCFSQVIKKKYKLMALLTSEYCNLLVHALEVYVRGGCRRYTGKL